MINYRLIRSALRARARTLSVVTTGSVSLGATGYTYTRASGSFITDGFVPGFEITTVSGFTDTAASVVTAVAALTLTVSRQLTTEGASSGRTLTVGLPSVRAWENRDFNAPDGFPWVEEQLAPGPTVQLSTGPTAVLEATPVYQVSVCVPTNRGVDALDRYADALIEHFYPNSTLTLDNGDTLRVRGDTGPYRGSVVQIEPSWAMVPVSFPLRLLTRNAA